MTWLQSSTDHRLVQVFMDADTAETYEVYVNVPAMGLTCTCRHFWEWGYCDHVASVAETARALQAPGPCVALGSDITQEQLMEGMEVAQDPEAFRAWVLKHSAVIVL